jgi:hypothetical protein
MKKNHLTIIVINCICLIVSVILLYLDYNFAAYILTVLILSLDMI